MILTSPDLDTLLLALTSGAVPPSVSLAPVAAGFDDKGQVWLQPSVNLPKAALTELRRLKFQTPRTSSVPLADFSCWLQLAPVQRNPDRVVPPEQAPVLFDLPVDQLSSVVTEILRLGNDRQSFRYLVDGSDEATRVLLRVVGPPYYSLLRALDRDGPDAGPIAYVEAAARLWIQVGHTHPLSGQVKVPAGKILLLQPPRRWTLLDDAPFRDIYEILEFVLPDIKAPLHDTEPGHRLKVPLRLVPGDPAEADELWVVRERPVEQLDELVSNADDGLLRQLSFAVAEKDGEKLIVLRARPSKAGPPELVLQAVEFRTYQKLPNLFLPSGRRLQPPLSRHVIRKLLADDPAVITWLYPHGDGTFTPETLPDEAFRPLTDWIDYILDHDKEALQTWMQAALFDFESFVCSEDQSSKPKKPPGAEREKKGKKGSADVDDLTDLQPFLVPVVKKDHVKIEIEEEVIEVPKAAPNVLQEQRRALEARFLGLEGPLDSPERQALWPELAALNAALGQGDDAGICWLNALWQAESPPVAWAWNWFRAEAVRVRLPEERGRTPARSWVSAASSAAGDNRDISAADLDRALALREPESADVRALAAYVFWSAQRPQPAPVLVQRLVPVRHFLETHERLLPVRAVWLAWCSLVKLSAGDVLGLARARDRLLERLFQNGLRPELDLANFLRFAGQPSSDRFRAFRHWMVGLAETARRWLEKSSGDAVGSGAVTEPYACLIFAFGLARLGEADASRTLLERAKATLASKDQVHTFLLEIYTYRIEQMLEGKPWAGPLPPQYLEYLAGMGRDQERKDEGKLQRYIVDRLRAHSRILEPDQLPFFVRSGAGKIDPYREWGAKRSDLDKALAELPDIADRKEAAERVAQLLKAAPKGAEAHEYRARVLRAGLDLAPLVGEEFAIHLLGFVGPTYDALPDTTDEAALLERAQLLEKGLFAAAHFDCRDHVQALVARFQRLLQSQRGVKGVQGLNSLAGQCFRGLRKLGMRDEIDQLLRQISDLILDSQGVKTLAELLQQARTAGEKQKDRNWLEAFTALLHVASGWYFFGRDKQAENVLDAARSLLYSNMLLDPKTPLAQKQTLLACTYAATLGQAPVEVAQKRIEELFQRLEVRDTYTTNSHYKLSQLDVLEAVVLAVVTDDFTMGSEVRRWLDEDEFLVRRRIHHDLRTLMAHHE